MEHEITTAAERSPVLSEPTLTLGQVERLLHAATQCARAQQPVVYQAAPEAGAKFAPASKAPGGGHPGIDVTIPPPPGPGVSVAWAPVRRRVPQGREWGLRLAYASIGLLVVGAGSAAVTDGSPAAIAAIAAAVVGTGVGTVQALAEQDRGERAS